MPIRIRLDWLASRTQESSCLCLPEPRFQVYVSTPGYFTCIPGTDLKSFVTRTLLTEPSLLLSVSDALLYYIAGM